jgi:hypothetical protein
MSEPSTFNGPINGHTTFAGTTVSGGNLIVHNHALEPDPRLSPTPNVCQTVPFPRNEDIVYRPDLFTDLETLLPTTPSYHSAALWGLGGSG